jgi:AAA+ ATPase superfamily predicted ATPase
MQSPFPYDKLSLGSTFIGRQSEIEKIKQLIDSGNNLLLFSKRRLGKSSLIKKVFEQRTDDICLYCDVYDITKKEDFSRILLKSLSAFGVKKSWSSWMMSVAKRLKIEMTIDPNTGKYALKPAIGALDFDGQMNEFFTAISALSEQKRVVIALDEFQQVDSIKDIRMDAYLRKYVQERNDQVSFIFAGSKRHILTSLFGYHAPLYEMATHHELQSIAFDAIKDYVSQHLLMDDETLHHICTLADHETKLMQHIFHLLYIQRKKTPITISRVDEVVTEIVNEKEATFRLIFDGFNNAQKMAIKIVAKYHANFYSETVLKQEGISKSALQSAIKQLFAREIIDRTGDSYFIPDRTLELWVRRMVGM